MHDTLCFLAFGIALGCHGSRNCNCARFVANADDVRLVGVLQSSRSSKEILMSNWSGLDLNSINMLFFCKRPKCPPCHPPWYRLAQCRGKSSFAMEDRKTFVDSASHVAHEHHDCAFPSCLGGSLRCSHRSTVVTAADQPVSIERSSQDLEALAADSMIKLGESRLLVVSSAQS